MSNIIYSTLLAALIFSTALPGGKKPKVPKNYAQIPAGQAFADSTMHEVKEFYIGKFEVSNTEYRAFLNSLKASGDMDALAIAQIDSSRWSEGLAHATPFTNYYHSHPAYTEYPAVNIPHEGAVLYCDWLTKKYREENPEGPKVTFRLPAKEEWIRAARPEKIYTPYPWGNNYVRDGKGRFLANFKLVGEENLRYDLETKTYKLMPYNFGDLAPSNLTEDVVTIVAPVKSFLPTEEGIHNQSGNVAEMISDPAIVMGGSWRNTGYDIRIESEMENTAPAPHIGFRVVMEVEGR